MEKRIPNTDRSAPELLEGFGCENQSSYKRSRKRDRSGENFRKRWQTLVKTGHALHRNYGARIYFSISIPKTRRDFVFRSDKDVFPITPDELVCSWPLAMQQLLILKGNNISPASCSHCNYDFRYLRVWLGVYREVAISAEM